MADIENEELEQMTPADNRAVAESEFDRWAEAWRLDTDFDSMPDEERDDFSVAKRKICNEIIRGTATVDDAGDIEYTLFKPVGRLERLKLKRPGGRNYHDMDKGKLDKTVSKLHHMISGAIGQPISVILRFDGIDIKFIHSVYGLFLVHSRRLSPKRTNSSTTRCPRDSDNDFADLQRLLRVA